MGARLGISKKLRLTYFYLIFGGINVTNKAYSVITDVEFTISPFNFQVTFKQGTDGNKMVILLFVLVYCTLNKYKQ